MCNFRDQGDDLSCLVQIGVAQVPEFAAMGFRSIVCNRPDAEEGAVPSSVMAAAAHEHGLAFIYQPVKFSTLGLDDGAAFGASLDALPKPVLAYRKSGRRAVALWALARVPRLGVDAVLAASRAGGCELDELRPLLTSARDAS